jgi:hypothetical protein
MNATTYTKIVKSATYNDNSMSLGFRRYFAMPNAARKAVQVAAYLETKSLDTHSHIVNFFAKMTEVEYKQYVITH